MTRPVLLDLCCCGGGAAEGYRRAGFDVIGVDTVDHSESFSHVGDFHLADALTFPLDGVDGVHASPPCQRFSTMTTARGRPGDHPDLIDVLRRRFIASGLPYVIENVVGAPLRDPVQLCGSSFGLGVRRHRLFESNFPIPPRACHHAWQPRKYRVYDHGKWYLSSVVPVYGTGGGKAADQWAEAMGIDWPMTRSEIAESIPPAYTEHVGRALMQHLTRRVH